jgi:ligand-binding sensor domain-containing protein
MKDLKQSFTEFSGEINRLAFDKEGKLWVLNLDHQLYVFDGKEIQSIEHPFPNMITALFRGDEGIMVKLNDSSYYSFNHEGFWDGPKKRRISMSNNLIETDSGNLMARSYDSDVFMPYSLPDSMIQKLENEISLIYLDDETALFDIKGSHEGILLKYENGVLDSVGIDSKGELIYRNGVFIYIDLAMPRFRFLHENNYREFPLNPKYNYVPVHIKKSESGAFGDYVIYTRSNAKEFIRIQDHQILNTGSTGVYPINNIEFDKIGNIWLGTHDGLKYLDPHISSISDSDPEMVSAIHVITEDVEGNIWFGGYQTGWSYFDGYNVYRDKFYGNLLDFILPGSYREENGDFYFFTSERGTISKHSRNGFEVLGELDQDGVLTNGYMIKKFNEKYFLGLQNEGLGYTKSLDNFTKDLTLIGKNKGLLLDNVLCMESDKADRIWCGRHSQGIAVFDTKQDSARTWLNKDYGKKGIGAISMYLDDRNYLWFGTNKGLYYLKDPEQFDPFRDDLYKSLKRLRIPGPDSLLIGSMIQWEHYLVFGNSYAVYFLDLNSIQNTNASPTVFPYRFGKEIPGSGTEQNCMYLDTKGMLWIGSDKEVIRMDVDHMLFDTFKVGLQLNTFIAGRNTVSPDSSKFIIPKDFRAFSLSAGPKQNGSLRDNLYYDIVLSSGKDTLFKELDSEECKFSNFYLLPGRYTLKVLARKNGIFADELMISIVVPRTLTENPLFWIFSFFLLVVASILVIYFRQLRYNDKLKSELMISQLSNDKQHYQIQSIISSFNPHFINNSLHWAQSKYRKDKSLVKLISSLSANIGYLFSKTREGKVFHSLDSELKLVQNYVDIQLIRFDDSFTYVPPSTDKIAKYGHLQVLVMQIQIHVENAIEHGLRNRIESSFVEVDILEMKDYYEIHITDDGIGRIKAKIIDSKGTQNGTKMLNELHQIFNQNKPNRILTKYEDEIFYMDGVKFGTRVIISIPKTYQYEY